MSDQIPSHFHCTTCGISYQSLLSSSSIDYYLVYDVCIKQPHVAAPKVPFAVTVTIGLQISVLILFQL